MQEINELKNLVIQGLESNGVLSQIRAQIRASVFKIIDNQEGGGKKPSGFFWENPLCYKLHESPEGLLALSLIFDFFDAYRMDYSITVFQHEANLKEVESREMLFSKLGLKPTKKDQPALLALIKGFIDGEEESKAGEGARGGSIVAGKAKPGQAQPKREYGDFDTLMQDDVRGGKPAGKAQEQKTTAQEKPSVAPLGQPAKQAPQLQPPASKQQQEQQRGGGGGANSRSFEANSSGERQRLAEAQNKFSAFENTMKKRQLGQIKADFEDDEYRDEKFEEAELDEEIEREEQEQRGPDKRNPFGESDEMGVSQSQGFDQSYDSLPFMKTLAQLMKRD
eukprot:TRINITY_DN2447_c0_g1_i5.p1 TRINITY_DN2447_c0_g1~~TRINITY_DN2447_c0_g1_i5.p1  ORF type:complete len:337 (-),score=86.39 TRINITY_DN2447_c0_g1_i5:98-1108(-)